MCGVEIDIAVQEVMVNELKSYQITDVMDELFARYFEMLAMSYEVGGFSRYKYHYHDVIRYFTNTTQWILNTFNPMISSMIDGSVQQDSQRLIESLGEYQKSWANSAKSREYSYTSEGKKLWASGTQSTNRWAELCNHDTYIIGEEPNNKKLKGDK